MEEAVFRNLKACLEFYNTLKAAYGPYGRKKLVINHLGKIFVTSDASTIVQELEIQHPAAKLMVMASKEQERECGDGTNLVLVLSGAMLGGAEKLLKAGVPLTDVIEGYELASAKALEYLEEVKGYKVEDLMNKIEVAMAVKTALMSKMYGQEDFLAEIVSRACINTVGANASAFNVDNIRILKVLGADLYSSEVMPGMAFKKDVEGTISRVANAKIAVFTCPIDNLLTETKGTVVLKNAAELKNYNVGEETLVEQQIQEIADIGINVVVAGGKIGDLHQHFLEKYKIMMVRLASKFDLRRLCKLIGAVPLPKLTTPMPDDLGYCDSVHVREVGETVLVNFLPGTSQTKMTTIMLRGATENAMDDTERALDDAINTYKVLTRDCRLVPGAGATEMELSKKIADYALQNASIAQYSIAEFARCLEAPVRGIASNAGIKDNEMLSVLQAAHVKDGNDHVGIDVTEDKPSTIDTREKAVYDTYLGKHWAVRHAVDAALTILRVDQIIMAKQAGGPKPPKQGGGDMDDD